MLYIFHLFLNSHTIECLNQPHEYAFKMIRAFQYLDSLDGVLQAFTLFAVVLIVAFQLLRH